MSWFLLVIIAAGVLLMAVVSRPQKRKVARGHHPVTIDRDMVSHRWHEIERAATSGGLGLKGAISEADKLLDYVMRGQGVAGDTMAERLKHTESRLSNKEAVWRAHKLRNHLAHEAGFEAVSSHVRESIRAYEHALKDLGVLK